MASDAPMTGVKEAGLFLHMGNRLEALADELARVLKRPLSSPFVPETILVQSRGMQRWICMSLAQRSRVFANGAFPFPNTFVEDLFQGAAPEVPAAEENPFHPSLLAFRILALLPGCLDRPGFEPLTGYLKEDPGRLKRLQLAERIADLFDQYLVFRPEMVFRWESGKESHWQARLWRRLAGGEQGGMRPPPHRARMHRRLLKALQDEGAPISGLPERVSVFGISYLPPFHLEVLAALAGRIPVHLFFVNPCREYWADIVGRSAAGRIVRRYAGEAFDPGDDLHLEEGNRLLASTGALGRDFLYRISEMDARILEHFTEPGDVRLLDRLQSDILHLRRPDGSRPQPPDGTMQVHACHSPMREIEVLHDRLLAMFEQQPALQPRDILVMTPDIEAYTPLIHAVFDAPEDDRHRIPYSVADRSARRESSVADGLLKLMALADSRLFAGEVLALFENPALRSKFGVSEQEVGLVEHWVAECGIRWGRDERDRAAMGLPAIRENSWQAGIDRLLLGYAVPAEDLLLWDIAPYGRIEGADARIMGRFVAFVERLFAALDRLSGEHPPGRWRARLEEVLADFFQRREETEVEFRSIEEALEQLTQAETAAGCREPLGGGAVRSWLERQLDSRSFGSGFLSGGVTFCAMVPMRSIPFKVICMIGMNSGVFPRESRPLGFDRMAAQPRSGDRNRRDDDKYLFLEALVSARECLYISYVGQSIQDNAPIPPSALVSELIDAVAEGYGIPADSMVVHHPLQAFSPDYFRRGSDLFSYSTENFRAARSLFEPPALRPFWAENAPLPEADFARFQGLTPEALVSFFAHPARFLLRQRLGVRLESAPTVPDSRERFSLDGLQSFLMGQEMVQRALKGERPEAYFEVARARGELPHGSPGEAAFKRLCTEVQRFVEDLERAEFGPETDPAEVHIDLAGFSIRGRLEDLHVSGICRFRFSRLRSVDLLAGWLRHLLLCTMRPAGTAHVSQIVCRDASATFDFVDDARKHLASLLGRLKDGLCRPLPFFPVASEAYARSRRSGADRSTALQRARSRWDAPFGRSESEDPYHRCCFQGRDPLDEEFCRIAEAVWDPILDTAQVRRR